METILSLSRCCLINKKQIRLYLLRHELLKFYFLPFQFQCRSIIQGFHEWEISMVGNFFFILHLPFQVKEQRE